MKHNTLEIRILLGPPPAVTGIVDRERDRPYYGLWYTNGLAWSCSGSQALPVTLRTPEGGGAALQSAPRGIYG